MPIQKSGNRGSGVILRSFALGVALVVLGAAWFAINAAPKPKPAPAADADKDKVAADDLQRSLLLDTYRIDGNSGAARGEVIYAYKCWMCHNEYTKGGPYLADLYSRPTLLSGPPVNDENVAAKIKNGGPLMPAFHYNLSDSEVADLIAYIHSGKCCVEGENPPMNPWYRAETHKWSVQSGLTGGAMGVVRIKSGDSPEGVGVQLIAPNGVRTTVYTNGDGKFEFPKMQSGSYALRIPSPVPFKPYVRDSVSIDGATKLDDIVLERVADSDDLPASPLLESQLSGAEILFNLPGSAEEKAMLQKNCSGCHSWQQIFRNRYDEHSWALIVDRMMHFTGTAIAVRNKPMNAPDPEADMLTKFLTRVRGPESQDMPIRTFPRPHGESTRVVVTEYELPRNLLMLHDAALDAQGNVWYTSHKTRYVGKLDPKTGIVKDYTIPLTPGAMPGTHHAVIDKNGIAWISENWAHQLNRLDPKTGEVHQAKIDSTTPINAPSFGNFTLDQEGNVWDGRHGLIVKMDPNTGKVLQHWPLQADSTYDNTISYDGKYWGGSGPANWGNTVEIMEIATGKLLNLNSGAHMMTAKRGGFDPFGNTWWGGADGSLIELNFKAQRIDEFTPPIAPHPYTDFYEAMPDKNGEIWAGVLHGRQMLRYTPKTDHWTVYQMPEPYSYNRRTVIDTSTKPATVWYVDYNGYLVRVQPLD
jgi:streptogramin lyase/mono/diheme cytochrome c family protein